jgi:hypothetical protein
MSEQQRYKPRAPREARFKLDPVLLLDGGRAVRGDVRPAEIAPDKWISMPGGGETPLVAGATMAPPLRMRWSFDAVVVRWWGYNANDENAAWQQGLLDVKMQLQLGGPAQEQMIINGETEKYVSLAGIFGLDGTSKPIYRVVREGDIWIASFRNDATINTYSPDLVLGVRLMDFSEASQDCMPVEYVR